MALYGAGVGYCRLSHVKPNKVCDMIDNHNLPYRVLCFIYIHTHIYIYIYIYIYISLTNLRHRCAPNWSSLINYLIISLVGSVIFSDEGISMHYPLSILWM